MSQKVIDEKSADENEEASDDEVLAANLPPPEPKMTIWEHLEELRSRFVKAMVMIFITSIGAWYFRVKILAWLLKPFEKAWVDHHFPGVPELQTLSPADPFIGYLELTIFTSIICSAPIIFYQLWQFVSPGLYQKEKRFVIPFVFFSTLLFLSGVAFAYYVAFPFTFNYFFSLLGQVDASGTVLTQRPTLEFYLDFVTRFLLAFGFVFELPLFISFMAIAGIVTPMQLLKFSRWAILLSFIVGAIATPGPEVTSQLAVSGALVGLYFISIAVAFIVGSNKKKPPPEEEDDGQVYEGPDDDKKK
jgi:sec-independent protein translocase protein TatC